MENATQFYLGLDGGGSGCRARLFDQHGVVHGAGEGGPANLSTDFNGAKLAITEAAAAAVVAAGLLPEDLLQMRAVLGLAGGNVPSLRAALEESDLPFAAFAVRSDAEIACLGAHGGADGGILILGTGSQGILQTAGRLQTVGGWGFSISDTGSGAILGRALVRRALLAHEGVEAASSLTKEVMAEFDHHPEEMLSFGLAARPADWARFCPMLFAAAEANDPVALKLVLEHTRDVTKLLQRMAGLGAERIVLMGGLAAATQPYLGPEASAWLVDAQGDAVDGAWQVAQILWLGRQAK